MTETLGDDSEYLETNVAINEKTVTVLKARVNSIRADVSADRLFIQTSHSENVDSFSILCFELSSGNRLWQTREIPPGGSLYVDGSRKTLEAGITYGYATKYLVRLDYAGNILERNFRSGYEMISAAEQHFANKEFEQARSWFLQALETKISINTKIKAAKKLTRIGKTIGDATLSAQFAEQAANFESQKEAERTLAPARPAFEEPLEGESTARDDYWNKRWKQIEEEGGS